MKKNKMQLSENKVPIAYVCSSKYATKLLARVKENSQRLFSDCVTFSNIP